MSLRQRAEGGAGSREIKRLVSPAGHTPRTATTPPSTVNTKAVYSIQVRQKAVTAEENNTRVGLARSVASAEREPITGVWGLSPLRGSRGRAPGGGQWGKASLQLMAF